MSKDQTTSLLGRSPLEEESTYYSYGSNNNNKTSRRRTSSEDEEDPLLMSSTTTTATTTSLHSRTKSWHKHGSDVMTGDNNTATTDLQQQQPSAFAPLLRTLSSGRAETVVTRSAMAAAAEQAASTTDTPDKTRTRPVGAATETTSKKKGGFVYYIIYAIVNVIISLPGLYGYAHVIFNHPIFGDEMNALSKFVIFSSLMHQLGFLLFSSLPFAIGTVQDAGLIFLSSMSNTIANDILNDNDNDDDTTTKEQVISTTLVLLSLGTAMLGLVLVLMGYFKLADAVSYLPMPVVGGYLAFIGYFCLQAGVGLSISESMMDPQDWSYLLDPHKLLLAMPALISGLLMTFVSRNVNNDAALPCLMVLLPTIFYIVIYATGVGLDGAREGQWVGQVSPPVPVSEMLAMIDFKLVRWSLIFDILHTWVGMIFVVSFASCLDVAAISLDMGEPLETNRELATVGICNIMSGCTFGYTGSYIFSQTIFTYRTGVHSKWIGFFIMVVFFYVTISPMNVLQMAPLFFFGATLIFIGYDLLYEWLIEIRHKIFLSEYAILWATFLAIQVVGIDIGIILGVLVAIVSHVVSTAQVTAVHRVSMQSRAVWTPSDYKLLHDIGYHPSHPKIVTLEIVGTVFFGSSLQLLERISDEIGLNMQEEQEQLSADETSLLKSPHRTSYQMSTDMLDRRQSFKEIRSKTTTVLRSTPKFVVLDLTLVPNLDVSAARGCFLQLAKLCAKRSVLVCAAGANPRIEWMLRSHDVAYSVEEEARVEARLQAATSAAERARLPHCDRVLLFVTIHEALEFCENVLIHDLNSDRMRKKKPSFIRLDQYETSENSIAIIINQILELDEEERKLVETMTDERYHSEVHLKAGQLVFDALTYPSSFYIVLKGAVAIASSSPTQATAGTATRGGSSKKAKKPQRIVTGAGFVQPSKAKKRTSALLDPNVVGDAILDGSLSSIWPVGGLFGYVDYMLERPRKFRAVAAQDDTIVAKFTRSQMALLRTENPPLDAIVQRVLLRASIMDLATCTCRD